jgi:hypothetical protein
MDGIQSLRLETYIKTSPGASKMAVFAIVFGFLVTLSHSVFALPPSPNSPIQTVHEFANETWVENIAVRPSGELLVTIITSPDLYQIDPQDPFFPAPARLVHSFPYAVGTLGIAEIQADVFAVITGNFSSKTLSATSGSFSLWKVDLRSFKCDAFGQVGSAPAVTKIADIHEASLLTGLTIVAPSSPYLLASDSVLGVVWQINHYTGQYEIVLDDALMKPVPGQEAVLGIYGIHTRDGYLYFANTFQYLFARVRISPQGTATGPYEVLAHTGLSVGFAFDNGGNAYITQDPGGALEQVTPEGKVTILAGNSSSTILTGDTGAAFGRTRLDDDTLYVVTNGGIVGHPAGSRIVGGKVLAVNIPELLEQHQA